MSQSENDRIRNTYSQIIKYVLALVTGAIVFFPAISSSFKAPFLWDEVLFVFWVFSILSLVLLCFAFYISNFRIGKIPHRTAGLGNLFGVIALIALVVYSGVNTVDDRTSAPRIVSVTIDPPVLSPGQATHLSAEATDDDSDQLHWNWFAASNPKLPVDSTNPLIGSRKSVYWFVPKGAKPGPYNILVQVSDDQNQPVETTIQVIVQKKESEEVDAYLKDRLLASLARIARNDPDKADLTQQAEPTLFELVSQNVVSIDALRDDPKALEEALEKYFDIPRSELFAKDFRPCCKDYPGTWPVCNPDC